ncbi:DUF664 domain-containing protein [Lapillicoccus sp.]|uniref:mycothiol transferase n=1 Tax=Lapillicoccus sp. TaxID=1909287 RepID=UPI00326400EC
MYRTTSLDHFVTTAERAALRSFLTAQRTSVQAIVHDLDEHRLGTVVAPSGWSPLGLVEHLGHAERFWFQYVVVGSAEPLPWPDNTDAADQPTQPLSRSLARPHSQEGPDEVRDLRSVVLHLVEETARTPGHLDTWTSRVS